MTRDSQHTSQDCNPRSERSLETRITNLEISLAHQQRYCEQLNEVIIENSHRIDSLERESNVLRQQLLSIRESAKNSAAIDPSDERPPHY